MPPQKHGTLHPTQICRDLPKGQIWKVVVLGLTPAKRAVPIMADSPVYYPVLKSLQQNANVFDPDEDVKQILLDREEVVRDRGFNSPRLHQLLIGNNTPLFPFYTQVESPQLRRPRRPEPPSGLANPDRAPHAHCNASGRNQG